MLSIPEKTLAHGAKIQYRQTSAIAIQAKYDDGTPMANAQVVIYAPSDRTNPWLKGETDAEGNFSFIPDTEPHNIGNWDVKVRQSGHGNITSIPINRGNLTQTTATQLASAGAGYSLSQKIVMAAAVGWGFVGTTLFFARPKSDR
ncbi:MAG: carboxypeptidase regulatory-like domain-containing protein [Cyanobacteria bacterium J06623_7]